MVDGEAEAVVEAKRAFVRVLHVEGGCRDALASEVIQAGDEEAGSESARRARWIGGDDVDLTERIGRAW